MSPTSLSRKVNSFERTNPNKKSSNFRDQGRSFIDFNCNRGLFNNGYILIILINFTIFKNSHIDHTLQGFTLNLAHVVCRCHKRLKNKNDLLELLISVP